MTLCAQYTDNMKKRTLAPPQPKPKRPRGKKVFSTDKGAKR